MPADVSKTFAERMVLLDLQHKHLAGAEPLASLVLDGRALTLALIEALRRFTEEVKHGAPLFVGGFRAKLAPFIAELTRLENSPVLGDDVRREAAANAASHRKSVAELEGNAGAMVFFLIKHALDVVDETLRVGNDRHILAAFKELANVAVGAVTLGPVVGALQALLTGGTAVQAIIGRRPNELEAARRVNQELVDYVSAASLGVFLLTWQTHFLRSLAYDDFVLDSEVALRESTELFRDIKSRMP